MDCILEEKLKSSFELIKNSLTSNTMTTEFSAPFCVSQTGHARLLICHHRPELEALHLAWSSC